MLRMNHFQSVVTDSLSTTILSELKMDSVSSSFSSHASTPIPSFTNLGPENQLAVLQQISPHDRPTLRSLASTNQQMLDLATPLLMEAHIVYAERRLKTMVTPAQKAKTILLIHHKLVENADGLPLMGSVKLWERLRGLMLEEAGDPATVGQLLKSIGASLKTPFSPSVSVAQLMAMQQTVAIYGELAAIFAKAMNNHRDELTRAVKNCY